MRTDVRQWERGGRTENELRMALRLAAYFKRQKKQLLDGFESQRVIFEAVGLKWVDVALLYPEKELDIESEMETAYSNGQAKAASACYRGSFELANPTAIAYAQRRGAELVTAIDATTRRETKAVITRGLMEGKSYGEVARDLRDLYDGYAGRRALTIAVTEATKAYSAGTMDIAHVLQDNGLAIVKSWDAEPDCCADCGANADDGWIPLDDAFSSGWDSPGDSHPNCRCNVQTRVADPENKAPEVLEPMGYEAE